MGLGRRIGNLYVSLGLNTTAFNQGFKEASKALEQFKARTEKNKLAAFANQIGLTTRSLKTLESTAKLAMGSLAAGVGVMGLKSLVDIADKYTLLDGRLKLVTKSSQELVSVQASLYQISQKTRTDYSATADLYTQMARSTESLGLNTEQLLKMTEGVNKALIVSGASSESANAALIQLGQGMASGVLRGEELNSVLEQTPRLAKMIADGMGITIGQLRQYGKDGKLTAEAVTKALIDQAQTVDGEFQQMGTTVGQAMTELKNAFESVVSEGNKASGSTDTLAGKIEDLAKTIESNKGGIINGFVGIANSIESIVSAFAGISNWITNHPEAAKAIGLIGGGAAIGARFGGGAGAIIGGGVGTLTYAGGVFKGGVDVMNSIASGTFRQPWEKQKGNYVIGDENAAILRAYYDSSRSFSSPTITNKTSPVRLKSEGGGKSALERAQEKEAREREKLTEKILDAQEWYAKEFEAIKGQYEAGMEAKKALENLELLLQETVISQEQYNAALQAVSQKYHESLMGGQYDTTAFNLGAYNYKSSDNDLTDRIANKQGIDAIRGIESVMSYSGIRIAGWDQFEASYTALSEYFSPENQAAKGAKDYAGLYKGLAFAAAGIGQAVGGKVGNAISSTLSGVIAGSSLGPVGAVVGGAIGLVSSIFGSSDDEEAAARRSQMRQQVYDQMVQSALSGGSYSLQLLRDAGWDYDLMRNYTGAGAIAGKNAGTRLLDDRGETGLADLSDYLAVMDQANMMISEMSKPSVLRDLESAKALMEYSISQVGEIAEVVDAYMAQMVITITGISADTIGSFISNAVSANTTGEAGAAFSEKFEASIAQAIRDMAISNLVTNSIMPILQPALTALVTGLTSGSLTSVEMASLYGNVKAVTSQIEPMITVLSEAFDVAGIGLTSGTGKAISANSYSSYADYALASAGVPGFAGGGSFSGGWRIVGEYGPELEYTGPSRIFSNPESRELFDISRLEAAIASLKEEIQASNYAIAKNTARTAQWLEKWEKDGLPKETTV